MMIERLPCTPLHSALNAKVRQLARWTLRDPREVNLEVNRRIGVRTRRTATDPQLRAALRYVQERLNLALSGRRGDGTAPVHSTAQDRSPL
ncbi:hypothetical protein [Lentzea sp. NPDC051838]|uniref:hypothetical protein n=1 Tax=Lentzea sp. NPDC051838 TaxID=3154849 RepID=UPI003444EBA8